MDIQWFNRLSEMRALSIVAAEREWCYSDFIPIIHDLAMGSYPEYFMETRTRQVCYVGDGRVRVGIRR